MRARSQKTTIDGTTFDSLAEGCFYCWLVEAKELGIIIDFTCQPEYPLTPRVTYEVEKQLVTKTKMVKRTLLQSSSYTADFECKTVRCIDGLHTIDVADIRQYAFPYYIIDVKGAFNKAASNFSLLQKMMQNINGHYVNKVVVAYDPKEYSAKKCSEGFFAKYGVPQRLPAECYQKDGITLYAVWRRMFDGLPSIKEACDATR